MDHHRDENREQKLAQLIKQKTIDILQYEYPTLHMRFHLYVSYPPEDYNSLVYFNTEEAMEVYNQTERTIDDNKRFNTEMNMYSKFLYETHQRIKSDLINS